MGNMANEDWLECLKKFSEVMIIDQNNQSPQEYFNASMIKCILAINEKLEKLIESIGG